MQIRSPWRAVSAMFILNGGLYGVWASRIPTLANLHELSASGLGLLLLVMAAGGLVSFSIAGRAADHFGAKDASIYGGVGCVLGLIAVAISPNIFTLSIAVFLYGGFLGGTDVAMNAWAAEVERGAKRPMMASFHAMFSLGAGIGASTGFFAAKHGLALGTHFAIVGILLGAITLWFAMIAWQPSKRRLESKPSMIAFPKGVLLIVALIAFCCSIGEGGVADWSAYILVEMTNATESAAALGYTAFSITMVIVRLMADRMVVQIGAVNAARAAGVFAMIGVIFVVAPGAYIPALIGFALMGVGYAVVIPLAFSRAANEPSMNQGAAIASVATLGYGGMLIGPPVIGFLAELTNIRFSFGILAILAGFIVYFAGFLEQGETSA
ncbi:transporter [Amylibacter kogurei]|uniref:Transporter n=1 Tax=Paramylibacter kogurei TaxID=1889778 RepID=A0A2G5KAP5_9RHOB|nr:MFS transporter [Amylibacter kogurei]PIB26113.1 transporter [Amylibacter kogurei]